MRTTMSAPWVQIASFAVLVLFLAPLPLLAPPEPERYVLAEIGAPGLASVAATGVRVVEQYEGTFALLRVTPSQAARLRWLGVPLTEMPDRTVLDFSEAGIRFDTSRGEPALPAAMRSTAPRTFVVQFIGPIKAEWMTEIERLGANPQLYTPNHAYVVRMDGSVADEVRALPFVSFLGAYHPAYKIPTVLAGARGPTLVTIIAFDGVSEFRLARRVSALGGAVLWTSSIPPTVEAVVDGARIGDVARLEDVAVVYKDDLKQTLDRQAGIVHGFGRAWYRETSGLPTTLTGVSNGPDGIRGTADDVYEIVGIQDTGLDEGNANAGANDFFQGPFGSAALNDRVIRFTDQTGCSVPDGARGGRVAHGSHVAGIVASNGYSWEKYLIDDRGEAGVSLTDFKWDRSEAGAAPEAKISFDGVNGCAGGVNPNPNNWLQEYVDGARTMVNSWGGGITNYNGNAQTVDDQMDDSDGDGSNDRMIEFSAGNAGPDYGTQSGDAQAKNGLSIGASQNFRPDQFEADNPDLVASFSSKGGPLQGQGRIKPDLVAIGTAVVSLFARGEWESVGSTPQPDYIMAVDKYSSVTLSPGSDGIPDYRYLQGTSMAGPMAAGLYMLAREYLREAKGIANPNSQLVKALLINGAVRMDPDLYPYPGWDQGWGRIDLPNSVFPDPPKTIQFEENSLTTTGQTWNPTGINLNVVSAKVPLKITLVWIDPPAIGGGLVRDLNLKVTSPGGSVYCGNNYDLTGWSRSFGGPNCGAGNTTWDGDGNGWDQVNNVEQVEVQAPAAGAWAVQVIGFNVAARTPFALVVSADVGPTSAYRVDLATSAATTFSVAQSGSINLPFLVTNYGNQPDSVVLSAPDAPAGITVRFAPTGPVGLLAGRSTDDLATIEVAAGVPPGLKEFSLVGTSNLDPNPAGPSTDSIPLKIEVTTSPVPFPIQVTNSTTDELDPSVVVFNATGTRHVLIPYRKTSPVLPGGRLGGVNVWLAHTTLDNNGMPVLPFQQIGISGANDQPNDLRAMVIPSGTFANRVIVTWTGTDPNITNPDLASYGRVAYADPPYTSWTLRTIETNIGSSTSNVARVSFPLFRVAGGGAGQLIWVWEHLDYVTVTGNPTAVQTHATISTDGGATWSAPTRVFPPGASSNFYFFPHGVVDQNDVAWIFVYFRTATGNDRDLAVRLFDGAWSASAPVVWDTTDNIQWPAVLSTAEGANGNRVYVAVTRDALAVDLKLWVTSIDGGATPWSSSNVPRAAIPGGRPCGTGCTISQDFAGPFGPFGLSASSANYNRRPILNFVSTVEGGTTYPWLAYMENNNPFQVPNLWTYYGTAAQWTSNTPSLTRVTADSYAKGHQMTSTLTTGGVARLYEVYHASRTAVTAVDYQVYLGIYQRNWETLPDTEGPLTTSPAAVPSLVDLSQTGSARIAANVNDMSTGNSSIAAAEFFFDATGADGTGRPLFASDGAFDSPAEGVQVLAGIPDTWSSPSCHDIYIHGQDAAGNWGAFARTQVCVQGFSGPDTTPPLAPVITSARLSGPGLANVELRWQASVDEGFLGGTVRYRVFRAASLAGPWTQLGTDVIGAGFPSYAMEDVGVAPNTFFYYVQSIDGVNLTANSTERAGRTEFAVGPGLNLVSLPFVQADEAIGTVLQTLSVRGAWTFDACSQTWSTYDASRPIGRNSLRTVSHAIGLYVDATASGTFAVAGLVPGTTTIPLCTGWNLIGNPSWRSGYTVGSLKAELSASQVLGFSTAAPGYTVALSDATVLQPGASYWVKVGGSAIWIVPGQ